MHIHLLLIPLLFSSALSATVKWTTYTDAACTVKCPIGTCETTLDTSLACNQNSESSNTNLVCGADQISKIPLPNPLRVPNARSQQERVLPPML